MTDESDWRLLRGGEEYYWADSSGDVSAAGIQAITNIATFAGRNSWTNATRRIRAMSM